MRPGEQTYSIAFGDPYPMPPNDEGFINEPVFRPPLEGDPVSISAVSVAPDGKVWFSSATYYTGDIAYGVAAWTGRSFRHYDPEAEIGMAERPVSDLIALPDGRLVLSGPNSGLMFWNPATGQGQRYQVEQGLPDDRVLRMYLDTMVSPPALYISTAGGGAVLRQLPGP
jgi:sugar lactone lactonase YvrE